MDVLKLLLALPNSCIYALVNKADKKLYIQYTTRLDQSLTRLVDSIRNREPELQSLIQDLDKCEFQILEIGDAANRLKLRMANRIAEYKLNGWSLYKEVPLVEYKIRRSLHRMGREGRAAPIAIYLVSKRNDKTLVGMFYTADEAQLFTDTYYPNDKVLDIVYAKNELSKKYGVGTRYNGLGKSEE